MPTGKIKFYNKNKGYGFIIQDDGGQDIFLHNSALLDKVMLEADYSVEFDIERGKQGLEAHNIIVIDPDPKTLPPLVKEELKADDAEKDEEVQDAQKQKQDRPQQIRPPTRTQDQADVRMSIAFMTKQVQTEAPLEFALVDNEKINGKLAGFDAYTIKVISDANEKYLVQKHALKYIKKIRVDEDETQEPEE